MDTDHIDSPLSMGGTVVEILERGGARVARVVLAAGTVIEVPSPPADVALGEHVTLDASLQVTRVRGRDGNADHAVAASGPSMAPEPPQRARFEDYEHVVRMAGVFALGVVAFLVWRSFMVPRDFGQYGHFRGGAIADAAKRTPVFAGQAACVECHDDVQKVRLSGRHATIGCEACHGALGAHARGETDAAPVRPSPRGVCLTCHSARPGMPAAFKKIVVKEHSAAGPCTECHPAHAPGIS